MAENSIGWTTNGTGDGSASGYTMAQFTEWQRMLFAGQTGTDLSGVAPDYQNKLAVSGTSSPVAVNTGGALAYGFPYVNTASLNVVVPTPSTLTRIDRIVLEVNWAAQTVRVARVAGSEGGAAPSLTQTAATTWQMPLAQASITTGGAITLTDQREWLTMIGDGMVTTAKIADDAVTFAKMQNVATDSLIGRDTASTGSPESILLNATLSMDGAGNLQRAALTGDVTASAGSNATTIANNAVTLAKMADASVGTVEIVDLAVTTAKIGALQVTAAKLAADVKIGPTVMYIPIVATDANPGTGGGITLNSTSYSQVYPEIEITKEHFPTTCTIKLVVFGVGGTTNLKSVELYNKTTSASVSGSEVTSTFNGGLFQLKSGDIRANLTAGANRYTARMKKAAGSITVYNIYLLVEWS